MAFTGVAVIEQISDRKFRITGLSLAGAAAGTISLNPGTGEVQLTDRAVWNKYEGPDGSTIGLDKSVQVSLAPVTTITTLVPIMVVKTGDGPTDFLITLTNTTAATVSALQEIYIEFH